ncbi:MAG TPA: autotransporter domain-containing protein, partial [Caulobacteraceae bacterium]|nr:autotransporter domain-containing protein [Caulobacteraceae bacterium]
PNGGGAVDFSGVAWNVTFTHAGATNAAGRWLATGHSVFGGGNDTLNFLGIGHNVLGGRDDLAEASVDFGAGNDTLNLAAFLNIGGHTQDAGAIDFGAGTDTFNLNGIFNSHGGTLANLEALNLSGTIFMGAANTGGNNPAVVWDATDRLADDVLRVHGATFTGSGDARVVMDVDIGGGFQAGCETLTGVADCLDLRGGTTAGVTMLTLNNLGPDARQGGYDIEGITLVDVGGGASAQGHFVLDPATTGLRDDPLYGAVIGRPGLFSIALRYDSETQRHVLVSLPHGEIMEYAMLSGAAQSIWHLTAQTVTERQTDLRERPEGGSVWLRAAGEYTKRTSASSFEGVSETYFIDSSHKLYAGTIMGGMDLLSGYSGGYDYVAGAQIGYVASSFDLNASETSGRFAGATGGVYASIWSERMFLDGTFNLNGLTLDYDSPSLDSKTNTYTTALGARLDGGLRWPLMENLVAEPLASLAFARTGFEEISLSGGEIRPSDATSRRGALGLRLAGTLGGGESLGATYFVTGRAWHELDGEAAGVINNPGQDLVFYDELSGGFGEAEAGINLFNPSRTLSGFLASGVKFKDGYSAVDLSLGLRMAW